LLDDAVEDLHALSAFNFHVMFSMDTD
jgi:hypothetical protein